MRIIRVDHEAAELKVLAVPLPCPMSRSAGGCQGHHRTPPQASRPGLMHVSGVAEDDPAAASEGRGWRKIGVAY